MWPIDSGDASVLKREHHRITFEEFEDALVIVEDFPCQAPGEDFFAYANMAIFSLIMACLILGLLKHCHY